MEVVDHFLYTKEHEWVNIEEDVATVGITSYAQQNLGDITFIELPTEDDEVDQFGELASVESVKAASDIFSPMTGKVREININLQSEPGLINQFPYENGWIAKIALSNIEERENLMTADEYRKFLESQDL